MIVSELEVSEVMTRRFLGVAPEDTLGEAAPLRRARRSGCHDRRARRSSRDLRVGKSADEAEAAVGTGMR